MRKRNKGNQHDTILLHIGCTTISTKCVNVLKHRYNVIQVESYAELYDQIPITKPSAIILYVNPHKATKNKLPKWVECLRYIRRNYEETALPVITIGPHTLTTISQSYLNGATDHLQPQFHPTELISRIQSHIRYQKLQKKIHLQNKQLKTRDKKRERFVRMAAHELRNPIHILKSCSGLLNQPQCSKKDVQMIAGLVDSVSDQITLITNDLLSWQTLEIGSLNIKKEPLPIHETISQIVKDYELTADNKKITLVVNNRLPKTEHLHFDPARIYQILSNLINNAIKFSDPNTQIKISAKKTNDKILVEIIDQGPGIPEDAEDQLFKPFPKIANKPTKGEPSTGLGLALCKNIIQKHGGKIGYRPNKEMGSTFYIQLPKTG